MPVTNGTADAASTALIDPFTLDGVPSSPLSPVPSDFDWTEQPSPIFAKVAEYARTGGPEPPPSPETADSPEDEVIKVRSRPKRKASSTLAQPTAKKRLQNPRFVKAPVTAALPAPAKQAINEQPTGSEAPGTPAPCPLAKAGKNEQSANVNVPAASVTVAASTLAASPEKEHLPNPEMRENSASSPPVIPGEDEHLIALEATKFPAASDVAKSDGEEHLTSPKTCENPALSALAELAKTEVMVNSETSQIPTPLTLEKPSQDEYLTNQEVHEGPVHSAPTELAETEPQALPAPHDAPMTPDPSKEELVTERSSRKRTAPSRYIEESSAQRISPLRSAMTSKRKLQPLRGNWSANYLLSNSKSRLASCNISDLLNDERAWTALAREDQLELILLLPDASIPNTSEEPLPNIPKQYLRNNTSFQADVRLFQEDLAAGRYDPKWLKDAQNAMEKRANGLFDDWKERNREEFWGQKQKIDWTALAGESSQHKLTTLVAAGCFEIGDVWLHYRVSRRGGQRVVVEKEAKIVDIAPSNRLTFSFPPGIHKFSSPAYGEDLVLVDVDGPTPLSEALVREDGRIPTGHDWRSANTWKDFRCLRKNQDMGSLWDIRELYHQRNQGDDGKRTRQTTTAGLEKVTAYYD